MDNRRVFITFGLITMFLIAPLLSWFIGGVYGTIVSSGFAAAGLTFIMFPIFFIVGVIMLIKGLREPKQLD